MTIRLAAPCTVYCRYQSLSLDISEHFVDVITVTGVDLSDRAHRRRHFWIGEVVFIVVFVN